MNLESAQSLAMELMEILSPHCERIEIAGSIRRQKPDCKDIELVCIPKTFHLEKYFVDHKKDFIFDKSGGKYKRFNYKICAVDLFICSKENWGLIFLIRTGSKDFSKNMLAKWKQVTHGGYSDKGFLYDTKGKKYNTYCEEDVFSLCETSFVMPEDRF